MEKVTAKIKQILEEIARGEGPYSRDQLTHAENCVENMKKLASEGLAVLGELEKSHVVVEKEKVRELLGDLRITVCCVRHAPDIWGLLKENKKWKEKAERELGLK